MRISLLLCCLLATPAFGLPLDAGQQQALEACLAQRLGGDDNHLHRGFPLDRACPDLALALPDLSELGFSVEQANLRQLLDLNRLNAGWTEQPTSDNAAPGLDPDQTAAIVADLQGTREPELDWWQQVELWLRRQFGGSTDTDWDWLTRWTEDLSVPDWLSAGLLYGSFALVILAALGIIANELRGRRWRWHRRRDSLGKARITESEDSPRQEPCWAEIKRLPPRHRPVAIWNWTLRQLRAAGRLPAADHWTNHELLNQLTAPERGQAAPLAAAADRGLYGRAEVAEQDLNELQARAEQLAARIGKP